MQQQVAKAGKDSKKPGKTEVLVTKDVKKSLSGMESLVTLLDYKLQSLPFEKLKVFWIQKIVKSKPFKLG